MDEKLTILLKHLPALQAEGVTALAIDGLQVTLRPKPLPEAPAQEEPPAGRDPLTFGLPPGTKMPSLRDRRGR